MCSSDLEPLLAMTYIGLSGKGSAFRAIFELAAAVGARGCAVLDADLRSVSPAWVDRLVGPVLQHGYDLVTRLYARHKLDGTITNSVAFPLTAALYGRRLRQPIGGDFGFSGRLAAQHFDGVKEAIHQASERPEGFVLPVELWARICYDYLVAYNAQVIDHDRLVSSMILPYFARTATFVREAADDTPEQAEERIASFAEVFLAAKPYLVERWRVAGRPRRLGDQRVPGEDRRRGDDTSELLAVRSP